MTCIVGYRDTENNRVVMGADSAGSTSYEIRIRKDTKIFKNGDFVIGCTSSFRMIQILRFSFKPPEVGDKDIYEYMCTDFVDAVRESFSNGGYLYKSNEVEKGGIFLIAYKDRLFCIESDFQVGEVYDTFNSVGCGDSYALGAMHVIKDRKMQAEKKVIKALESASYFSTGVRPPFNILTT